MAKFINLLGRTISKKTVFRVYLDPNNGLVNTLDTPDGYENIRLVAINSKYGGMFIAYDKDPTEFDVYFGEVGEEFE